MNLALSMGLARAMELPTPMCMAENTSVSCSKLACTLECKLQLLFFKPYWNVYYLGLIDLLYTQNASAETKFNINVTFLSSLSETYSRWTKFVEGQTKHWKVYFDWLLKRPADRDIILVRYEDLKKGLLHEVERILTFLHFPYTCKCV